MGKDTGGRTSGVVVNAGAKVTGGRTGNIVGMLGPGLPVDVPADQGVDSQAGTARATPKLAGDRPKNQRAPTQEVDRYLAIFF